MTFQITELIIGRKERYAAISKNNPLVAEVKLFDDHDKSTLTCMLLPETSDKLLQLCQTEIAAAVQVHLNNALSALSSNNTLIEHVECAGDYLAGSEKNA